MEKEAIAKDTKAKVIQTVGIKKKYTNEIPVPIASEMALIRLMFFISPFCSLS